MKLDLPYGRLVYQAGIKAALGSQDPNLYNIHSESLFCTKNHFKSVQIDFVYPSTAVRLSKGVIKVAGLRNVDISTSYAQISLQRRIVITLPAISIYLLDVRDSRASLISKP